MLKNTIPRSYGVIGLGRFGTALAKTLASAGKEVIVIDNNESKVKELRRYTEHAYVSESLSKEVLQEAGIQNCDTVIVCIGAKIDTSILTTLNVVSLGVPKVIAKAISYDQGAVLEKIGAEVVYPEYDMALRLGKRLLSNSGLDSISLGHDIEISELMVTHKLIGKTILKANFQKHGLSVIAIEHDQTTTTAIDPHYVFVDGDIIVVIGKNEKIKQLQTFLLQ